MKAEDLIETFNNLKEAYSKAILPENMERQKKLQELVDNHRENLEILTQRFQNNKISANTFNKKLQEVTDEYLKNFNLLNNTSIDIKEE